MGPSEWFDSELTSINYQRYSLDGELCFTHIKSMLKPQIAKLQKSE